MKQPYTYSLPLLTMLLLAACGSDAGGDASLSEEVTALEAQVGALGEERNALQGRVEQLQAQLSSRTTALQEAQARVQTLTQQQGNILESEISDINTRIEALQQERSQLNARLSGEGAAQPAENAGDNSSAQPQAPEGNE